MTSGGVRCWGGNAAGQLGDGTTTDRLEPPTSDVLTGAIAIAAGGSHTCALMKSGGVRCWGGNSFGQLGDGTMNDRAAPPDADVISDVKRVSTGDIHTCVLLNAGGIRCWGHNINGEVGIGNYSDVLSPPTKDVLSNASAVAAGYLFTCGLSQSGGVRCWGYNGRGQIGDETDLEVDRLQPAESDVLTGVEAISVGTSHTCALMKESHGVRCWGHNGSGQLGNGAAPDHSMFPPSADLPKFALTCP
jgi:alpha-tubulin suppressor-like RCC1 family protein